MKFRKFCGDFAFHSVNSVVNILDYSVKALLFCSVLIIVTGPILILGWLSPRLENFDIVLERGIITWEPVKNADRYKITYEDRRGLGWAWFYWTSSPTIAYVDAKETSYDLTQHVDENGEYIFAKENIYVEAVSDNKFRYWNSESNTKEIFETSVFAPMLTLEEGVLSWPAVEYATGYGIYKKRGDDEKIHLLDLTENQVNLSELDIDTTTIADNSPHDDWFSLWSLRVYAYGDDFYESSYSYEYYFDIDGGLVNLGVDYIREVL